MITRPLFEEVADVYCGTGSCAPGGTIHISYIVLGRLLPRTIVILLGSKPRVFTM
jgi:hypothetical protein